MHPRGKKGAEKNGFGDYISKAVEGLLLGG